MRQVTKKNINLLKKRGIKNLKFSYLMIYVIMLKKKRGSLRKAKKESRERERRWPTIRIR